MKLNRAADGAPSLQRLLSLATPLFAELALGIGAGLIGTGLAAGISDTAAASFSLANHVAGMLFILFRIIGAGVSVVVTQSLGSGRRDLADRLSCAVLGAGTWVGGMTAAVALIAAAPLLRFMNAPLEVLALGAPFLQAIAPAMLLDAWIASMSGIARAHFHARETLQIAVATQLVTLTLAVPLMHGVGTWHGLGLVGFAVAVAAGRALALWLYLQVWKHRLNLVPQWRDWWRLKPRELAPVLRIGLPGAAENIAYRLAFMVTVAVAGQLGTQALATQSYVLQISYVALMFGLALGFAVEIVVGHMVGAGHLHDAHHLVRRAMGWGLVASVLATAVSASMAPLTLRLFTDDSQILGTGILLLWYTVALEPGRTFNLVIINALRAAGDARYPVVAGAASMLIVLAGGSWLLGSHFGLGLTGIWIAYAADEWIRGLLMWRRWAGQGWLKHARASRRRLRRTAPDDSIPR